MVKKNHILLFLLTITSCGVLVAEDEEFTFQKTPYNGNEIRLDGYYFNRFPSSDNGDSVDRIHILFFFRNGVTLSGESPTVSKLPEREEAFKNGQYYNNNKSDPLVWGVFKLDSNGIILSEWWANPNGTLIVYRNKIRIVNDTTLEVLSSERIDGSKFKEENRLYQFKAFVPKPDSIVDFIH